MNDLKWFFPESGPECLKLFDDGFRPHGGGTFLVKSSLNVKGLFDTSRVNQYRETVKYGEYITIGSAVTYSEAADFLERDCASNMVSQALSSAASTPLRNRITIGGSITAAPKWSDAVTPFAAAGASVKVEGKNETIDYSVYSTERNMRKNSLVASVELPAANLRGLYYRFTLTGFDYPFFTIAVSFRGKGVFIAAVSGCAEGLKIFSGSPSSVTDEASEKLFFNKERGISEEYLKHRAMTELKRLLETGGPLND